MSSGYKEVTPKVGSVDVRDLSIRRPQMKVGKTDFIDTYTPFWMILNIYLIIKPILICLEFKILQSIKLKVYNK